MKSKSCLMKSQSIIEHLACYTLFMLYISYFILVIVGLYLLV